MRVSYNWLKQYLDLKIPAEELARRLTLAGLEYDEIIPVGGDFSGVVVGKVLSAEPVAGSDHLSLCRVDAGTLEPLDIICGAPNVRPGLLVACAKVGARLPGDLTIGPRKAFGITSQGMLCSQQELGVSDDHSGIWELNDLLAKGTLLGVDVADALQLRDEVIGIELTPNRGDCLGMINLAREAAVVAGGSVCYPNLAYEEKGGPAAEAISIEVKDAKLCPRYTARLVKNIKIGPSPLWMQKYLLAAGMRPINNVVDISNYVMLEMNQPLHTFDYAKLRQQKIMVRPARPNETMTTLDGKERIFQGGEILICDGIGPVCIGGIMGGLESEVTPETTEVLIEAAAFDPVSIRRTARRLGIPSEASLRFEKSIDIANCDTAARRAAQLLVKYCGGIACSGVVDVCAGLPAPVKITLRAARVNQILGTNFELLEIKEVFSRLGFAQELTAPGVLQVSIPSYRKDISLEVDLIEEVARIKGFELIPKTMPLNATVGGRSPEQQLLRRFKMLAADCGLNEAVNYSFIHPGEADLLQLNPDHPWRRNLTLSNPLSEDQSVMRQSLLPGLLHAAGRNLSRRNLDLRFFEVGTVFLPAADYAEQVQPQEIMSVAMVLAGQPEASWLEQAAGYDYFSLKGIVEQLAEVIGAGTLSFPRCNEDYLHPGRAASIMLDGLKLGVIGELHPQVAENYQLAGRVIVAEFSLEPLFLAALSRGNQDHDLPRYPASTRDIAVIGSDAVAERQIAAAIRETGGAILRSVRLFDLYDQPPIASGQRSLAYSLEFRNDSRTLTDKEVDEAFAAIVRALKEKYAYQLR
jgi:phenylalanyl-tRNA synthetase beta chain